VNDTGGIPLVFTNTAVGLRKHIRYHIDQRTLPTSISSYCYNIWR